VRLNVPFALLVVQCGAVAAAWLRDWRRVGGGILGAAALAAVTAGLYWTSPYTAAIDLTEPRLSPWLGQQMRFAFAFLGVLAVVAAQGAAVWRNAGTLVALVLCCVVLVLQWQEISAVVAVLAVAAIIWWSGVTARPARVHRWWATVPTAPRRLAALGALGLVGVVIGASFVARVVNARGRLDAYGPVVACLESSLGATEPIAYLLSDRSFVLYGRTHERPVLYAPERPDDRQGWIASLHQRGVRAVAVGPIPEGPRWRARANAWLASTAGLLTPACGGDPWSEMVVYRIDVAR